MATQTFEGRIAEIDRRIREIEPGIAGSITCNRGPGPKAVWQRDHRWATLTLHEGAPPRIDLTFHGSDGNPETHEMGFYDDDVVSMTAAPIADFLAHATELG